MFRRCVVEGPEDAGQALVAVVGHERGALPHIPQQVSSDSIVSITILYLYFFLNIYRREELGQTIATSINYLKNLNALYDLALSCYRLEHPTFPQSFDSTPCSSRINDIKVVKQKLKLIYRHKIKNQHQELFTRKTEEARMVPEYLAVTKILDRISGEIPKTLEKIEDHVGEEGPVDVSVMFSYISNHY